MGQRALIYVQPGHVSRSKQVAACMRMIEEEDWTPVLVGNGAWQEAARLIREGQADLLLIAYEPRSDKQRAEHERIRQAIEEAGGEVRYCRPAKEPKPRSEAGPDTEEMVRRMFQAGCDTDQIVQVLRKPRGWVREILAHLRGCNK
jgi:hypothetical protein